MPQVGSKHTAAIEWKSGNKIEGCQQKIHVVEIVEHLDRNAVGRIPDDYGDRQEDNAQTKTRQRSRDGRQKFCCRRARMGLGHLRYTTEDEQRDLPHRYSQLPGNKTMAEFVQEHACKQRK